MRILIVFLLAAAMIGCNQSEPEIKNATPQPNVQTSQVPESADEPAEPKPERTVGELIWDAEKALAENDIQLVVQSLNEARKKNDLGIRSKMEIARLLFGAGEMKDSASVYDEVLEMSPAIKPQLWQRGLALYYAEEYQKGVDQFESHQTYNSQDVENSVWHLLCESRVTSVDEARKKMIQIERDSRIPMKQVFDMFAGKGSPEEVLTACGYDPDDVRRDSSIYHGLLYVGLFQEMMGDQEASNQSMIEALEFKPPIAGLMGHVAEGHLRARKAYPERASED